MKALVLGATSAVGKALSILYAQAGYDLILSSRKPTKLEPLKKDLELRFSIAVTLISLEAAAFESHSSILQPLANELDVAICIFGYLGDQTLAQSNFEETQAIINANYTGAVSVLNIISDAFEARKSGLIIGVSSVAGARGRQSNYIYGSAKAGFTAYLSGLRNRLFQSDVHVLTVIPGFMFTKMTEGMSLPKPITATATTAAKHIFKAAQKRKNCIYVLPIWWLIMLLIKSIPEFIFKRLNL
ncbi:MAG: SDR family oxidoreductase [Flammeovirgaceae bacterium]